MGVPILAENAAVPAFPDLQNKQEYYHHRLTRFGEVSPRMVIGEESSEKFVLERRSNYYFYQQ
jgi:hypothetical protein|tara:strand:+ start:218 stop:406 length:189 start_codon:yes stop_codon:yes gene_type:complete